MHNFNCLFCGSEFTNIRKVAKFCSHKCANRASAPKRSGIDMTQEICQQCKSSFLFPTSDLGYRTPRFCSQACSHRSRSDAGSKIVECSMCHSKVKKQISKIKYYTKHFCNKSCFQEYIHTHPTSKKEGSWYENGYKVLHVRWQKQGKKEHIDVMERHLGRKLAKGEVVHHINGVKDDNRIENLQVMTQSEHVRLHRLQDIANGVPLFGRKF